LALHLILANRCAQGGYTPSERRDDELMIRQIQAAIDGGVPGVVARELVSVLASVIRECAANPSAQARRLGEKLVETVECPLEHKAVN
jgi:hypothetical protein